MGFEARFARTSTTGVWARYVAAVVATAAAYVGGAATLSAPAAAAPCPSADGVTVVVDFNDLGGGVHELCDAAGGGQVASTLFSRNGFELTYVQKQPGFVCRINGVPVEDPCVNTPPADAYWGLWWSDGTDGKWSYSTLGAASLKIPEGGYVAFSWNRGTGKDAPSSTPTAHADPSPSPTSGGGNGGGGNGGGNGDGNGGSGGNGGGQGNTPEPSPSPTPTTAASPTSTPSPTEVPTPTPTKKPSKSPRSPKPTTASPTAVPVESDTPAASGPLETETVEQSGESESVPFWAVLLVIGALFAGAAAIAVVRRRKHGDAAAP